MTVTRGEPNTSTAGWAALFGREHGPVAVTLAAGVALHAVNVYLATTIMPSVVDDIGGASLYAWATTIFVFASVLGSAAAAAVLGARGPRASYRFASLLLAAGTTVCALAPNMPVLLAGRLVQGLGGGLLFALSYAMVRITLHEALWPRAMALVSAMWGVATLVGPALGGICAQLGAWRNAFWSLLPFLLFFGFWGAMRLPRGKTDGSTPRIPWTSVSLLGLAVLVISAASISSRLAVNAAGILLAALLLAGWLRRERGTTLRLIPATAFGPDARLRFVYLTMALLVLASTVEVYIPYFGQRLQGLGPLAAGYLGAVLAAGWTLGSIACSGMSHRSRSIIGISPVFSLAGLAVLFFAGPVHSGSVAAIAAVSLGLLLLGWGIGMGWPHLLTRVLQLAPDADQDLAGSSVTTIQLAATAFGSALAGTVANVVGFSDGAGTGDLQSTARWMFGLFALAPLAAVVTARHARR
ncbi:MFS transporter [Streptomyces sp. NBC_00893]|uniref:MFS transporter n=1 Tax=Streptomyces sp. NBC_00893 TaxID=2975862 RepID=UPI0022598867|nr:MFS transporter [Streptomyces sp. NBC_00893]MCX4850644.1 MFS transporter [Streptomyces sp. NBC_00893]